MSVAGNRAVSAHRKRLRQRGLARIEVRAPKDDAPLLRDVAQALSDPAQAAHTRSLLREIFAIKRAKGFKELLAAAPLEGLDLEHDRGPERRHEIDFDP